MSVRDQFLWKMTSCQKCFFLVFFIFFVLLPLSSLHPFEIYSLSLAFHSDIKLWRTYISEPNMYRTTDYLDLATDTQYLEPCLQSWNIRRCQSALEGVNIEDSSSDRGQNWGQDKRPSVRFLLAPHKDQEPGEAGRLFLTSPTPSRPADQPRQGLPGQSGDNENCLAGLESA